MPWYGFLYVWLFLAMVIQGSESNEMKDIIQRYVVLAYTQVNTEIMTIMDRKSRSDRLSFGEAFASIRLPSTPDLVSQSRSAEVLFRVQANMRAEGLQFGFEEMKILTAMAGCDHRSYLDCTSGFHQRYRSLDGYCNNFDEPVWGSTLSHLRRIVPARYEDGFGEPPGWNAGVLYNGFPLPSPRHVSTVVITTDVITVDPDYTYMMMLWGQFQDHDVTFVPTVSASCSGVCNNSAPCFPIPVPDDDPRITTVPCLPFTRSSATCKDGLTEVREQLNQITSFTDASNLYGSTASVAEDLRDYEPNIGKLRIGILSEAGKPYLPFNLKNKDCVQIEGQEEVPCFDAGDKRVNEHIALTAIHTLWLREHNRIVDEMKILNPDMNGDTLYYETRKITGAMMQKITYQEFLPKVIGADGMAMMGEYSGYKKNIDPTVINSFATASYRFGHGQIRPITFRLDENLDPIPEGNLALHQAFFSAQRVVHEGGIDPILRGMIAVGNKEILPTEVMSDELTERLHELANKIALDLASLNTQRGRDHGLGTYNSYRVHCGFSAAETFDDLAGEISDAEARQRLEAAYGHPDNIDLWVGGMVEDWAPGARVGPTFQCLLAQQFKYLRDGDRFWYQRKGQFTDEQLAAIYKTSLAQVLCDNGDNITRVQEDVFQMTPFEDWKSCEDIPKLDLKPWEDCCDSGFFDVNECYYCKFSKDNIGFVPSDNCHNFIRCQKLEDGTFLKHEFCCPENLFWDQNTLTCTFTNPESTAFCPTSNFCEVRPDNYTCTLMPSTSANKYLQYSHGVKYVMRCAAGTLYNPDKCRCDDHTPFIPDPCENDPMLHFNFNGDTNDCGCQKAIGTSMGNVRLTQGYPWSPACPSNYSCNSEATNCVLCFGEGGGNVEFGFLKNWFAGQAVKAFSISLWFYQSASPGVKQGLFGNGDCYHHPSIWLMMKDNIVGGSIKTNSEKEFGLDDSTKDNRHYNIGEWVHVGMALKKKKLVFYINGAKVDTRTDVTGSVENTGVGSTIGMAYLDCIAHNFKGCIDDLHIYNRYVKTDEFLAIFNAGPQ